MKMLSLKQAETQALNCRLTDGVITMRFLTFKRDRGLRLTVQESGFTIEEQGYSNRTDMFGDRNAFKKAFKEAFKREFPRSHSVYFEITRRDT